MGTGASDVPHAPDPATTAPDSPRPAGKITEIPLEPPGARSRTRKCREQPGAAQPLLGAVTAKAPERSRLPRELRPLRSFSGPDGAIPLRGEPRTAPRT